MSSPNEEPVLDMGLEELAGTDSVDLSAFYAETAPVPRSVADSVARDVDDALKPSRRKRRRRGSGKTHPSKQGIRKNWGIH